MAGADLITIFQSFATWEQAELISASVPGAADLIAFATFPTAEDVAAGLTYPYTCHGCDTSTFKRWTIGNPMEDEQTHMIWAVVVFGREGDPLAALSERDAKWRNAYRAGLVKHLHLGAASVLEIQAITAGPTGFNLEDRPEVGIKFNIPIETRVELTTGI
jgi:hypothetical protein